MESIGLRIKRLRKENKLTQTELANMVKVSSQVISNWEREYTSPNHSDVTRLSKALNATTDYILLGINKKKDTDIEKIPVGEMVQVPVIGTVRAGNNGIAYEEELGMETAESESIKGSNYFYLRVKGDSMINEGIRDGDLALVREQCEVESGELAVVIVNGEEGTIKRVIHKERTIILQGANPNFLPRLFFGEERDIVKIVGKVKEIKRRY